MTMRIDEALWRLDEPKKFRADIVFPADPRIMERLEEAKRKMILTGKHIFQKGKK